MDVTIACAPRLSLESYPYLAVTVRAPGMAEAFFLLGEDPRRIKLIRSDPFRAPALQVRAEWQAIGENGQPGPIVQGAWREAAPPSVLIDPATEGAP
jgi:hypothetical protein